VDPTRLLDFERKYWTLGYSRIAGVDEAGRGPLAGPVVAAAVVIDRAFAESELHRQLSGVNDSKLLTRARREHFCELLFRSESVQIGIGLVDSSGIDRLNILNATHLAMSRAVNDLPALPDFVLVDGRPVEGLPGPFDAIVRGDSRSLSIAAASIVAKVVRDDHMRELDRLYPLYKFAVHKGYGTSLHIQTLFEFGPCVEHRRSFRPVREAVEIRRRTGIIED
jgi:ribonuclease HII